MALVQVRSSHSRRDHRRLTASSLAPLSDYAFSSLVAEKLALASAVSKTEDERLPANLRTTSLCAVYLSRQQ